MPNLDQGQPTEIDDAPIRVPDTKLKRELEKLEAKASQDIAPLRVPVEVLGDREFELLVYRLFQDGQGSYAKTQCSLEIDHDDTALMQGTGDLGRDVALYRNGVAVGAVQCKHYAKPFEQPDALRQICRFILAAKQNPELMPNPQDFTYVLMLSRSANNKTVSLFHETATVLKKEPTLLPNAVSDAREEFKKLQILGQRESLAYVKDILGKIKLKLVQGIDLAIWLQHRDAVFSTFFQTRFVVEKEDVLRQLEEIKNALEGKFPIQSLDQSQETSALAIARTQGQDGCDRLITINEVYIQRTLEAEIDQKIEDADYSTGEGVLIAVIAPAGFGKTSLLWGCLRRWREKGNTVTLALTATQLATLIPSEQFVKVRTALLNHAATLRDGGVRFVVGVDTFDVLMHSEQLAAPALKLIHELVQSGASLVFSTRPEEVADIKLDQLVPQSVALHLREYSTEEFALALRSYCAAFYCGANADAQASLYADRLIALVASGRPARGVCLNPLALRMLFELYAPAEVPEDINAHDLYRRYLVDRVKADVRAGAPLATARGQNLLPAAKQVAGAMFTLKVPALTDEQFVQLGIEMDVDQDELNALVSRHLLRRSGGRVEFFHQTFFEYIAGLVMAENSQFCATACKTALIDHANDRFEFPIREHQLWHCANSLKRDNELINSTVGDLLTLTHPGPSGAALRLHMMDRIGYDSGRAYMLREASAGNAFAMKRYAQFIYHLQPVRTQEVRSVIQACLPHRFWRLLQSTSQMIIWLAPFDWLACKQLITHNNLIDDLCAAGQQGTNVAKSVADILRAGINHDMTFVLETAIKCLDLFREKATFINFLELCAHSVTSAQGQFLGAELTAWMDQKSERALRTLREPAARCLSSLWLHLPALCPLQGERTALVDSTALRLSINALSLTHHAALEAVYIGFIGRLNIDLDAEALRIVLHHLVAPLLKAPQHSSDPARALAVQQCERLLADLSIPTDQCPQKEKAKAQVIFDFIRELKQNGACPPSLQRFITTIPTHQWLDSAFLRHLLPMAVVEQVENATAALAIISKTPQPYTHHLEILCAALPGLLRTPDHLDMALNLAIKAQSSQLANAALVKTLGTQRQDALYRIAKQHAPALQSFCFAHASRHQYSAYLLLDQLITYQLIERVDPIQALSWVQREATERQTRAHTAAQKLLVSCTTASHAERTLCELLDSVPDDCVNVKDHIAPSLQHILCSYGQSLGKATLDRLVTFALRPGAGPSLISLAGWVVDIYLVRGDLPDANNAALTVLRSHSIDQLSQMQNRKICHRLDKPFQRLYSQLTEHELRLHLEELYRIDPMLGRVIVIALCKSSSPHRDALARQLTEDKDIDSALRTIVHDYRQFRWIPQPATV
ncbi:hypothetical protein HX792_28045 [Pseudomonas sp. B6002]|uniref:hypothetical protein n=1 Tax=Pseudomonas sp. B6002 TaxID=2726978 RepID=UPI0015A0E751|nr:hypothetical protein [Pseudomonas sp. B6002]NVZ54210.1 hypothetical protein [Pseudomonas sp. B6002]